MIEKMSFVTLAGPKSDIDRLIDTYLARHDIQLENALMEMESAEGFTTFSEDNPYKELVAKSRELIALVSGSTKLNAKTSPMEMTIKEAEKFINYVDNEIEELRNEINELNIRKQRLTEDYNTLAPFKSLNYKLKPIKKMQFFSHLFGRIPTLEYDKFMTFLDPDLNGIFVTCLYESDYVYGVYFSPKESFEKIQTSLNEFRFEEIKLPNSYTKRPDNECLEIAKSIAEVDEQIKVLNSRVNTVIQVNRKNILSAGSRIEIAYSNFDVRKMAACTYDSTTAFNVVCGWMTARDAKTLVKETDDDEDVVCVINNNLEKQKSTPPTKLRNPKIVRPFELFVKMYGLPAYNEFDPTIFLTITYALIFGVMFGDLGQGLCLLLGGFILYKVKKMDIAGIICASGFFSCIFGTLFGSFFGFEDIIPALWIKPLEDKVALPFLGELNTILVVAFCFGAFMILVTMIINMLTSIKQRNLGRFLFGPNALSGFLFYAAVILVIVLYMTGNPLPGTIVLVVMFVIPVILIFLEEPLKNLVNKRYPVIDESVGIYGATAFFELFEYMISYLSNSLSFLRIGVFAISHAAMMEVFLTLAGAENGGSANIFVVIVGNVIVLCMEGLIVGIQVLRLEYYEFFGRFYDGSGKEFIPYTKNLKN